MKKTEFTFLEGFTSLKGLNNNPFKTFDWDKAAKIISQKLKYFPNLMAEAGLQGDWDYTGGVIFELGKPVMDTYTFLTSNWAVPTLILSWDGKPRYEIECYVLEKESRFNSDSKWDKTSLKNLKNDNSN